MASFLEYLGDSNFKFFSRLNQYKYLSYGLASYGFMIWLLIYLLKHSNVMFMNGMWDAVSIVMETTLAFILLGETMTNNYQYSGLIFVVFGIILMNIGKIPI